MRHKKNITLNPENITAHFAGKAKIIILGFIIIMLNFTNITLCLSNISNTSALSYQTDVGINFTFNPTLSISLSPNNLTIPNLSPSTTDTSNEITINVSTNNVYGYNLYATVGNETHNNTNFTHANNTDVFSSIPATANLPTLTTDNTWGYTYSLDHGTTWSNYNGLPLYSATGARLKKTTELSEDTIDFKIAAKSSPTQASGTYTNIINFAAITNLAPITLAEAYRSEGKELYHGYYKMQDISHTICEKVEEIGGQLQVIDIRDDKVYWISKLADNNCWMTQNLDLDLTSNPNAGNYIALTSENTDLTDTTSAAYQDGYTISEDGTITWLPERDTIAYDNLNSNTWTDSVKDPYSYDFLDDNGNLVYPDSLVTKETAGDHGLSGNYYNWSAAIASNNSGSISSNYAYGNNSICSKGWQLPTVASENNTFNNLLEDYEIIDDAQNPSYTIDGFSKIIASPLYFIRAGYVYDSKLWWGGNNPRGYYWSSATGGGSSSYNLVFEKDNIQRQRYAYRNFGVSLRCLAR